MQSFARFQHRCGYPTGLISHGFSAESASRLCVQHARQGPGLPSTACRARLPHMDEEIEHMQWQLDKRTHEDSDRQRYGRAGARSSKSSKTKGAKQQHVFRDRRHSDQHHNHVPTRIREDGTGADAVAAAAVASKATPASTAAGTLDPDTSSLQQTTEDEAASFLTAAVPSHHQLQLQQVHELDHALQAQQRQQSLYYHLQLHCSANLSRARDRLLKHVQQDGGCYISAAAADSSMLTHLLLLLQQKQQQHDPEPILVLQPVDCSGLASRGSQGHVSALAATVGRVAHHGQQQQNSVCSCEAPIKLWVTAMPLAAIIGLQAGPWHSAAAASPAADRDYGSSIPSPRSSSSMWDGSMSLSMESSLDEATISGPPGTVVISSSSTVSSSSSRQPAGKQLNSSKVNGDNAALLSAASRSSSSVAAVIQQSANSSSVKHIRVGTHAEPNMIAAGLLRAVAAGLLVSLHVKGHATAHAAAYAAVGAAAGSLVSQASGKAFGVVLIPGSDHEHVHAVTHGHAAAEGSAGSGHRSERVCDDASMAFGGFGAAFYGVVDAERVSGEYGGLQHSHAQEVWLCVVPFGQA